MKKILLHTLPNRPLTSEDIINHVTELNIKHFRGVFSRDNLPKKPYKFECAILNLDLTSGKGTHWVSFFKHNNDVIFFDPFGDLPPLIEVQKYFKGFNLLYYYTNYQNFNTFICGHLCLKFLQCMNQLLWK